MNMMSIVDHEEGSKLMRVWGVNDWVDPGAEYVVYDECCIFALVNQGEYIDLHMAMDKARRSECREATNAILDIIGHYKLRAVILPNSFGAINLAKRMGFHGKEVVALKDISGDIIDFVIMWREPEVRNGWCN